MDAVRFLGPRHDAFRGRIPEIVQLLRIAPPSLGLPSDAKSIRVHVILTALRLADFAP